MKRIITTLTFVALITATSFAQLSNGSTAPDWTLTDINGNEHHLYEYLDNGYTVVIDFSATWCGPCWSYHTSGALEDLYINHGPTGMPNVSENTTNDVMVFFIEGDGATTSDDLNGTGSNTQGNWVQGTPYPIIDDASMTSAYNINAWPTIYTICPNKLIYQTGQVSSEAHYANVGPCHLQSYDASTSTIQDASDNNEFVFTALNPSDSEETFLVTLTTDQPADWSATLSAAGVTGEPTIEFVAASGTTENVTLNVVPGTTPAYATYQVELESLTDPTAPHYTLEYNVISGITDLVVDNGGVATQWNEDFTNGLDFAGNTSYAVMNTTKFLEGKQNNQLSEIEHVYYNMAWTFPSLTNDLVDVLSTFLDEGGNLFISGQDIGWDTWAAHPAANGTPQTKDFYTDYLSADYQDDGSGSNNQLTWTTGDFIFGGATNSGIIDLYDGNIYPDEIDPIDPAVAIYHYNTNTAKTGGVRVEENGHKVVYIGIDLAMISDQTTRNQTIQLSHDWFHGLISGIEFDELFAQSISNAYPNPAKQYSTIEFDNLQEDVQLKVMNNLGMIVLDEFIPQGTTHHRIDVSKWSEGIYQGILTSKNGKITSISIEVLK